MSFTQIGILMISYHIDKFQIRRNGEEEVMETDELNYQEVKTHKILMFNSENTQHIFMFWGELVFKNWSQASTDNNGGASVTSDLSFTAGTPGKLEVSIHGKLEVPYKAWTY